MPKIIRYFSFFILFNSLVTYSQTVEGVVKDVETKEVLQGVHILSPAAKNGTFSNEQGKFTLQLKPEHSPADSVTFSFVGYVKGKISISDLKAPENEIFLNPASDELQTVNLDAARKLNKSLAYTRLASMGKGAYAFGSTLVGDRIYVVGGDASRMEDPEKKEMARVLADRNILEMLGSVRPDFSWDQYLEEVQVYDLAKDHWTILPTRVNKRANHNVVFHDGKMYIFGGTKMDRAKKKVLLANNVEILDLENDSVVLDPVYPHQAAGAVAFKHKGDLLVMGGSISLDDKMQKTFTNDIHLFNFETGLWFDAGKMPVGKETTGTIVGEKFYFIGGSSGNWLDTTESLDLTTGKWKREAQLEKAFVEPRAVSHGKIIYIYEKSRIHLFDTALREMKTYRINLDVQGPALHILNDQLYLIGGFYEQDFTKSPTADCFKINLEDFDNTEVFRRAVF